MEIEKKYLLKSLPANLEQYPSHQIEQAYLCTSPVVRIRHLDDQYILTYKSGGMLARQEVELPLTAPSYLHLRQKADGTILSKKRHLLPLGDHLTIELDVFQGMLEGFVMAEVEFATIEEAEQFTPPDWFGPEVTFDSHFHNSNISSMDEEQRKAFMEHYHKLQANS